MWRLLCVVALCAVGLTACGRDDAGANEANETLESREQGLACEVETGYCPGETTCHYRSGRCVKRCLNGACDYAGDVCCTQPDGEPYCNSRCF
jgi:hypothetical protein